ncbi:DUF58 domain-containing protein [Alteromonas gilva]|uniref:DUF58 domain-containing protein n=1 Tax=Alteromonas gilva TaxID=2987522 RepID=A0ABT5L510_9ALTE|nr:DUF58 domain-containing protein [Alteromonas gilva]MDC8831504.1 DUF58 domain-containing protein [Alteromonas gilva]
MRGTFNKLQHRWLQKRIPAQPRFELGLNNVFVFPSRLGFGFLLTCAGIFILGTNYQNNLMILLCQFLLAIFLLHLFVTYRNFASLSISLKRTQPVFVNEHALLTLQLDTRRGAANFYGGLHVGLMGTSLATLNRRADIDKTVKLLLPAPRRGVFRLPRLTIASTYPLGLFRCWTHLDFNQTMTVYPHPVASIPQLASMSGQDGDAPSDVTGIDEFDSLRAFKPGDPMNRVAWKQAAKGGELSTKNFTQTQLKSGWLSLDNYPGEPLEKALSLLAFQVNKLSSSQHEFGLKLSSVSVEPASGEAHKHRCLQCLASYQQPEQAYAAD